MHRLLPFALLALLLAAAPAEAAKKVRVTPAATVPSANVELRGGGFRATKTVVRIGGRRAEVTRGSRTLLRVVVPELKPGRHRVVAGDRRGRIRIVRPYSGRVSVRPDRKRRGEAIVGPQGGRVTTRAADGTRFVLAVPAGALAAPTAITMAPAKVSGLPLTGRRRVAAHFEPEGLRFARPARLEMRLRRKPRGRFIGFSAAGDGTGLGFSRATGKGRRLAVELDHFSAGGAGEAVPQDILVLLQGIVESDFPVPVGRIELVKEQIGVWSEIWGEDVCLELCSVVQDVLRNSLAFHIDDACEAGRANPSLAAGSRIIDLEALYQEFGGDTVEGLDCAEEILGVVVDRAVARAVPDPLVEADVSELPPGVAGLQLDGEERITAFEWLVFLSVQTQITGSDVLRARVDSAISGSWGRIVSLNKPGCDTDDRDRATENLVIGWNYARRLEQAMETMRDALDHCRVEVDMAPIAPFTPGEVRTLEPRVHHLIDPTINDEVTWSASGGSITPGGVYTAPETPGDYVVTLKSAHNPNRVWQATVVVGCGELGRRWTLQAQTCEEPAVAIESRASLVRADVFSNNEVLEQFSAIGDWTATASDTYEDSEGTSSASATQTSGAQVANALFTASANFSMQASVAGTAGDAEARAYHSVAFTVAEEGAGYELQGTQQITPSGRGTSAIVLTRTSPSPQTIFMTGSATPAQSGTLVPGAYLIEFDQRLDANPGETIDASLEAVFSVG